MQAILFRVTEQKCLPWLTQHTQNKRCTCAIQLIASRFGPTFPGLRFFIEQLVK
jgi:hypothetical protein